MEKTLLLFNISFKVIYVYLSNKSFLKTPGYLHEVLCIFPYYPNFKKFFGLLFTPFKLILYNLDENICFLETDDKDAILKLSCDWCSINNGIIETAIKNIVDNPELINKVDFNKLKEFDKFLDFILIYRSEQLTNLEIENWCNNKFGKITIDLLLLSKIYLKLEMIELRWCPFKRSKEFYYRNKDKRFILPNYENIYKVGEILSKHETINCNNCPNIVNNNWEFTKSNKQSIFQPLLDYMIKEIEKCTTSI